MGEYDPVDPKADQTKKGWLTAILELGAWIGTLLSGFLAEVLSRKYGVLVACAVFVLGVIIQATAVTAGHNAILAGRFITYVNLSNIPLSDVTSTDQFAPSAVWVSEVWP